MLDAVFILIMILFFAIAAAYAYGCDRLRPRSARAGTAEEANTR